MRFLLKLSSWIDRLTEWMGRLSSFLVVVVVLVGFYNPVARYIGRYLGLKLSSNVLIEMQWYLFALIFFLALGYILKHGVNVRVDFLYTNWSAKAKALVDFIGHLFFLVPFSIMAIYVTWGPVLQSWGRRPNGTWGNWELSPDPDGLPRAPIKSMIIVAFGLLLLQAISEIIKRLAVLLSQVSPDELPAEEEQPVG